MSTAGHELRSALEQLQSEVKQLREEVARGLDYEALGARVRDEETALQERTRQLEQELDKHQASLERSSEKQSLALQAQPTDAGGNLGQALGLLAATAVGLLAREFTLRFGSTGAFFTGVSLFAGSLLVHPAARSYIRRRVFRR